MDRSRFTNQKGKQAVTNAFDLTDTYVVVAGDTATTFEGGEAFWKRLAAQDPQVGSVDGGWLVSSYILTESWPNWEMHPRGDEIVHCRSGQCSFITETADGTQTVELTAGRTVVVPRGTWHTAKVDSQAELLHITYGSGTTHKPTETTA
jgi:mannose-6-phosphate isomerase-like protein (cupin superfamily)